MSANDKSVPDFNDLVCSGKEYSNKPTPDFGHIAHENESMRDRESPAARPPAKK